MQRDQGKHNVSLIGRIEVFRYKYHIFLDGINRKFGHNIKFFPADIVYFNYIAQYIKGIRPLTNFL